LGNKVALGTSNEGSLLIMQDIVTMQETGVKLQAAIQQVGTELEASKKDLAEYSDATNKFSLWLTNIETHISDIDGKIELEALEKLTLDVKVCAQFL